MSTCFSNTRGRVKGVRFKGKMRIKWRCIQRIARRVFIYPSGDVRYYLHAERNGATWRYTAHSEAGALGARAVIVWTRGRAHAKLAKNGKGGSMRTGTDGLGTEWRGVPTRIGSDAHWAHRILPGRAIPPCFGKNRVETRQNSLGQVVGPRTGLWKPIGYAYSRSGPSVMGVEAYRSFGASQEAIGNR